MVNSKTPMPWGDLIGVRPIKRVRKMLFSGLSDLEIAAFLKNEHAVSDEKIALALEIAKTELAVITDSNTKHISLYIGIPFCPTRCLYCSFATNGADRTHQYIDAYMEKLSAEIRHAKTIILNMGFSIECIYIGGGTPTTLSKEHLDRLLYEIGDTFDLSDLREFTVEAGRPDTITKDKLAVLKAHNVSRISINPQTMNQETLDIIGRKHTVADIFEAYEAAHAAGFDTINADIIAGLPGETPGMFAHTLDEVVKLGPSNITVHTMSIKRASSLKENIDKYNLTKGSDVYQMVDMAYRRITGIGQRPYYLYRQKNMLGNLENIGYAKPGQECIYNIYIMEEIQTILSLGCGGVTKLVRPDNIERVFNVKDVFEYIKRHDEMLKRKEYIYEFMNGGKQE